MPKILFPPAIVLAATLCATAVAVAAPPTASEERIDHFQGLPADDIDTARANLAEYNRRLSAVLDKPALDGGDLGAIHELTYTLERALERNILEMQALAETLEALHVASETADYDATRSQADEYLEKAIALGLFPIAQREP